MTKTFRKLILLSVMALTVPFAVLSSPRTVAASEPCRIRFDSCQEPLMDCCCGIKNYCVGSFEECASLCG